MTDATSELARFVTELRIITARTGAVLGLTPRGLRNRMAAAYKDAAGPRKG